jgi:NAD(P)H-dependent FMN reductase
MNPATRTKIGVVLGSSREQALGERVIRWVLTGAKEVSEGDFALYDLASYQLPFFDEAIAPWDNEPFPWHADRLLDPDGSMVADPCAYPGRLWVAG